MRTTHKLLFVSLLTSGCTADVASDGGAHHGSKPATDGGGIAGLALANVGGTACGTNSLGGNGFESSCYGNGGSPEYWCADFAQWVWANNGVDVSSLSAAAGSFYEYGLNNGTLSNNPSVGAAVVFDSDGAGYADHVAIVTAVEADGTIETVSGDWNGDSGTEAEFSSTSSVTLNSPSYDPTVGDTPGIMGMTISGYITAIGVTGGGPPPPPSSPCQGVDDGFYCGNDGVPGDPNTLYQCTGGNLAGQTACANNCQSNPGDQDDSCGCAGLDDGNYCGGDDVTGDASTLYQCSGGSLSVLQVCANGCAVESGAEDDQCN
jgi:hypothetical protein